MVKERVEEFGQNSDTKKLENDIRDLVIQKLHGKKTGELVKSICYKVIPLIDTQALIFADPDDIKRKAQRIKEWKKKWKSEIHPFNPDKWWKGGVMVRQHLSSRSFEAKMIHGYIFQNPSDKAIVAMVYTHLEDPDREYILIDSTIAKNSIGADFLITALRKKYKTIWKITHSK